MHLSRFSFLRQLHLDVRGACYLKGSLDVAREVREWYSMPCLLTLRLLIPNDEYLTRH